MILKDKEYHGLVFFGSFLTFLQFYQEFKLSLKYILTMIFILKKSLMLNIPLITYILKDIFVNS